MKATRAETDRLASTIRQELDAWRRRVASLRSMPAAARLIWSASPAFVSCDLALRVVSAVIPVATLWVAKLILDRVAAAAIHPGPMTKEVWLLAGAEFLLVALGSLCTRGEDYCGGRIADEFSREVSQRVIRHSTRLDLAHFEDPAFQDLLERARLQATDRSEMLSDLGRLIQQAVTLVSLSVAAAWLSPWLFVIVILCMVPTFLGESHFAFASYSLAHEVTPLRRELDYLRQLCTSYSSIKEVKLFQLGNFLEQRFGGITQDLIERNRTLAWRRTVAGSAFAILGSLGYYGAYVILLSTALGGHISVGTLTFLGGALLASSTNIQVLFSLFSKIADQALFLDDLFRFLAIEPSREPSREPSPKPEPKVRRLTILARKPELHRGIEFRNVSFWYPGAQRATLRDVCFRIAPKERIALVGANGQGKTTVVKLLARLYEPTSGAIYLDGINLRDYDPEALWERMGIIFQDFVKYEMTAAENIAVGHIGDLGNTGLLHEAARASGSADTLLKLPRGLEQLLGRRFEGGVELSGGEWQKLALARAYLRRADILVLDEPTAALDASAEHEVFNHFSDLATDRMVLLISHRFSTVRIADRILVLEDGAIREQGTHDDLIARQGRYANMFDLQAANYR